MTESAPTGRQRPGRHRSRGCSSASTAHPLQHVNLKIVSIADLGHRKDELGGAQLQNAGFGGPQLQHVQFQEADIRETGFASARGLIRDQLANA